MPRTPEPPQAAADELELLRAEVSVLREDAVAKWVSIVSSAVSESSAIAAMENSTSWKVTRPLRAVRRAQAHAARIGYGRAVLRAASSLRRGRRDDESD